MSLSIKGKQASVMSRGRDGRAHQKNAERNKVNELNCIDKKKVSTTPNLVEQYAKSLKQQIQLLQIENNYLKNSNQPPQLQQAAPLRQPRKYYCERPETGTTQIMARGNEVSLNGETWCTLPAFHPSIPSIISERSTITNQRVPSTENNDRRGYSLPYSHSMTSISMPIRENASARVMSVSDAELLRELEESANRNNFLEKNLKQLQEREKDHQKVINSLTSKIKEIEDLQLSGIEATNVEKRALMEELLELQKRIDELTPVIAEKEVKIAQCESEKLELTKRLRLSNSEISNLQITITQLNEEMKQKNNKSKQNYDEMKFLEDRLMSSEMEVKELRRKILDYQERIGNFSQQVREFELTKINDKKLIDQLMEENQNMIKEIAKLTTKISRLEQNEVNYIEKELKGNSVSSETVNELKSALQDEKDNVHVLNSRLETIKQKCRNLEAVIEDKEKNDEAHFEERNRVEKELNALHALSKSLSSENKILREEKLSSEEIIDELKGKVRALEASIRSTQEIYSEKEKQNSAKVLELEEEASRKHQKYLEFEELSKTLHQITSLLPSKTFSLTHDCNTK